MFASGICGDQTQCMGSSVCRAAAATVAAGAAAERDSALVAGGGADSGSDSPRAGEGGCGGIQRLRGEYEDQSVVVATVFRQGERLFARTNWRCGGVAAGERDDLLLSHRGHAPAEFRAGYGGAGYGDSVPGRPARGVLGAKTVRSGVRSRTEILVCGQARPYLSLVNC